MKKLNVLNPEFPKSGKVIIYGTGQVAILTHTLLLEKGIKVYAFCGKDTDLKIMGKPIISEDELMNIKSDVVVVYAGENLLQAQKDMDKLNIKDYWVDDCVYSIINDCVWTFM